jgi:putative flavoprotein involved in K+ transport
MNAIDTVVIGAGHAGLAVSNLLGRLGRDHVVLDRGRIGESWRSERWDSLRLLTPRWMTRLPGGAYSGPDQEGFMSVPELVDHLERYADASGTPLVPGTTVLDVSQSRGRYHVATDNGSWLADNVVVATGPTGRPHMPDGVERLDPDIAVLPSSQYRNPSQLPPGGVLVVGASASGTQIADELARSGRRVVLAVGSHNRMPRSYRGMDVFWWLEQTGRLAREDDGRSLDATAPREPSLQLAGRAPNDHRGTAADLSVLQDLGVELVGRLGRIHPHRVDFKHDLGRTVREADARLTRFLDAVDAFVDRTHLTDEVEPGIRPRPVRVHHSRSRLDLKAEGIGTVLLATGFRPHHPWLNVPVVAPDGRIRQYRGATLAPGLYTVGQWFQHRRDSTFIDGARFGAHDVVSHLCTGEFATLERADRS